MLRGEYDEPATAVVVTSMQYASSPSMMNRESDQWLPVLLSVW